MEGFAKKSAQNALNFRRQAISRTARMRSRASVSGGWSLFFEDYAQPNLSPGSWSLGVGIGGNVFVALSHRE